MTGVHVVGLDLSLSGTGVTIARPGEVPRTVTIGSDSVDSTDDELVHQRLVDLTGRILQTARRGREEGDLVLFMLEQPAYASSSGLAHVRAGLWRLVYHFARKEGTVVTVQIQHLKQYATGKGNSKKDLMLLAADRAFPRVGVTNNDEADASWLAAMGMRALGEPFEVSAQRCHPQYLDKVRWPEWVRDYHSTH